MNPILSFYIYGKRYNTIDGDNTYIWMNEEKILNKMMPSKFKK